MGVSFLLGPRERSAGEALRHGNGSPARARAKVAPRLRPKGESIRGRPSASAATESPLAADLDLLVASAERLPTPPAVALELLALAQRDDVDVDQIAAVIARDPAIVSKILRVANT